MKKNYTSTLPNFLSATLAFVLLAFLSSCGSGKGIEQPNVGSLSVYNVSPTSATYDVYIGNNKLNSAALPFGGGIKYAKFNAGNYDLKVTVANENTEVYTKLAMSIGNNSGNTLYLLGTPPNMESISVNDDYTAASNAKAYVRFINLSPDAPALDLKIKDDLSITTNKTYKTYSTFTPVEPGSKVFEIKDTANGNVRATLDATTLAAGYFYTIISRGKVTPASNKENGFSGQVILHQ